jgi:hypothetical protein
MDEPVLARARTTHRSAGDVIMRRPGAHRCGTAVNCNKLTAEAHYGPARLGGQRKLGIAGRHRAPSWLTPGGRGGVVRISRQRPGPRIVFVDPHEGPTRPG